MVAVPQAVLPAELAAQGVPQSAMPPALGPAPELSARSGPRLPPPSTTAAPSAVAPPVASASTSAIPAPVVPAATKVDSRPRLLSSGVRNAVSDVAGGLAASTRGKNFMEAAALGFSGAVQTADARNEAEKTAALDAARREEDRADKLEQRTYDRTRDIVEDQRADRRLAIDETKSKLVAADGTLTPEAIFKINDVLVKYEENLWKPYNSADLRTKDIPKIREEIDRKVQLKRIELTQVTQTGRDPATVPIEEEAPAPSAGPRLPSTPASASTTGAPPPAPGGEAPRLPSSYFGGAPAPTSELPVGAGGTGGAPAPAPAPAPGAVKLKGGGKVSDPYLVSSQSDIDSLPKGASYRSATNPTGTVYTK